MSIDPKSSTASQATPQEIHTKAAEHCDAASSAHKEAAKHCASGDVKQAGYHAAVAQGHTVQAHEHSQSACKNAANTAPAMK
jgi:hypothetical protein